MGESSDPSLIADPEYPASQGAFPVWMKVFTKPGEKTFLEILDHPEAKAKSAYLWIFLVGILTGLISGLARFASVIIGLRQMAPELADISGFSGIFATAGLVGALCGAPLAGLFSLMGSLVKTLFRHFSSS